MVNLPNREKMIPNLFALAVVVGAIGLGLYMSPYKGDAAKYVLAFSFEALRLGLILVNTQIRKINPEQFRTVFGMVVTITIIQAAALGGEANWLWTTSDFLSAQSSNLALLFGEYALAVFFSGPTVDVVANSNLKRQIRGLEQTIEDMKDKLSEATNKLLHSSDNDEIVAAEYARLELESKYARLEQDYDNDMTEAESKIESLAGDLIIASDRMDAMKQGHEEHISQAVHAYNELSSTLESKNIELALSVGKIDKLSRANSEGSEVVSGYRAISGRKVFIDGVQQAVCGCGRITANVAGGGVATQCKCGNLLTY